MRWAPICSRLPLPSGARTRTTCSTFQVRVTAGADSASVEIAGYHTNVIRIEKNGVVQFHKDYQESDSQHATDRSLLTVEHIIAFANEVDIADVQETLQRQIDYNWAIAEEGLRGDYGANIGRILLQSYGMSIHNRAKAYAAAGSDARMNGCDLPVVINSGSGNQGHHGVTCRSSIYAKELGVTQEMLYRALVVSNLVGHPSEDRHRQPVRLLRRYGGRLRRGRGRDVSVWRAVPRDRAHASSTRSPLISGMICDGAKASCAAKIASAVEAGLLGMQMQMHESQFYGGDGIVVKGVENTIRNIGTLAQRGHARDRPHDHPHDDPGALIHAEYCRLPVGGRHFCAKFSHRRENRHCILRARARIIPHISLFANSILYYIQGGAPCVYLIFSGRSWSARPAATRPALCASA